MRATTRTGGSSTRPTDAPRAMGTSSRITRIFGLACMVVSAILTVLVFVAFTPRPPPAGLDGSWMYGLDVASARDIPFGRAVVFTLGPLVSVYTDVRVPSHDRFYLAFAGFAACGIVLAFGLAADPRRRPYLLLLPVVVANLIVKDAIFFVMPLALLVACSRLTPPTRFEGVALAVAAAASGLLPLIKGTLSVPAGVCVVLAAVVLRRQGCGWGIALPAIAFAAFIAAWGASGQRLGDLPAYLTSQAAVAGGYTDAMSLLGDAWAIYLYLGSAAALCLLGARSTRDAPIIAGIAFVSVGFVAFKAGFVRQDGHVVIAGSTLALFGYLAFLQDARRSAILAPVLGFGAWAVLAGQVVPVDPAADWSRFVDGTAASLRGIATRVAAPDRLFAAFAAAKARMRSEAGLPPEPGSADLYPDDLSRLLASDIDWNPRPVIQSYSAYTPELAAMNARHLAGDHAPDTLYFAIAPIDGRYPSLDDGASWPAILSGYDVGALSDGTATLVKTAQPRAATIGEPFLRDSVPFDTDVRIPADQHGVWAVLRFNPSRAGRVLSLVFKRPLLSIDLLYRDGSRRTARMIAGMASGGFLLSPTVGSARDFVALKSGDASLLQRDEVESFRIHQDAAIPFWGTRFDVELAPLDIEPDPTAGRSVRGTLVAGRPLAELPVGGDCSIDTVDGQAPGDHAIAVGAPVAEVEGWASLPKKGDGPAPGVRLALTDPEGRTWYSAASRSERPDVDAYFHLATPAHVGYTGTVDLRSLHGRYTLHVVQDGDDGPLTCATTTADIIRR